MFINSKPDDNYYKPRVIKIGEGVDGKNPTYLKHIQNLKLVTYKIISTKSILLCKNTAIIFLQNPKLTNTK